MTQKLGFFEIRLARVQDAGVLSIFFERSFKETFGPYNSDENMAMYCRQAFGESIQKQEIMDPKGQVVLACLSQDPYALAGFFHLRINQNEIDLARLYIDSKWHGQGLADSLMMEALSRSRNLGFSHLTLGVWENNERARSFYRRWGFSQTGEREFVLGHDRQLDLVLERSTVVCEMTKEKRNYEKGLQTSL